MTDPPTLLVLSPSTGGDYFGALLTGVTRELAAAGGHTVVVRTRAPGTADDAPGEQPDFTRRIAWDQVDGVVSITTAVSGEYLARIQATGRPVAVASGQLDGLTAPTAVPDNVGGPTAALAHLLAHGHTRIGFVGHLGQHDVRDRYKTYLGLLTDHGLAAEPHHLFHAPDNAENGGRAAAAAFLATHDRPSAVLIGTDRNALGFVEALRAAAVSVPRDVAVVGFDNIEASGFLTPALTTVDQPFDEVSALAARLVLAELRGEDVPPVPHVVPAAVVVRASCGCRPGEQLPGGPSTSDARDQAVEQVRRVLRRGALTPETAGPAAESLVARIDDLVRVARDAPQPSGTTLVAGLADLATAMHRAVRRPGLLRDAARPLDEYVRATAPPLAAAAVLATLRDVQAGALLDQAEAVGSMLDEQVALDTALMNTADPGSLDWLSTTHAHAAVLATWTDDGRLRVVGVHDPHGELGESAGATMPIEEFPPRALVRSARPAEHLLCLVEPVRTRDREWGLLALVATEIDSARESYHHWASLLGIALDQRALEAAVRSSEERYALVSRAARDGLWDFDAVSAAGFLSTRGRELLGLGPTEEVTSESWLRNGHPDDVPTVRRATAQAARSPGTPAEAELRVRTPDGDERWRLVRALAVGGDEVRRVVGSISDIDDRKRLEERLRVGALIDEVTGLPNRRMFLDRLRQAVDRAHRRPESGFAVLFLDLDGFKLVNDSLGHFVGDQLLVEIAHRLRAELRTVDTAARFGGDEFAVLLVDPVPDQVLVIARRVQDAVARPVTLAGHEVSVTASVGVTTSQLGYASAEEVLRDADTAMYEAKAVERGTASVFDPGMHIRATGRLQERAELRAALAEEQFVVHYQPVVALDGTEVSHFEALVRWQHPDRGLLLPGEFLPTMEGTSKIVALGAWVLDEVCRQLAAWTAESEAPASVAVNVSHAEFWAKDLPGRVRAALTRHGVPGERLALEITESVIMTEPGDAPRVMRALRALGVQLHIDDFGTGQSSLHALRTLPVDAVKIDGSFIRGMTDVPTAEMVRIIVELGRVLGLGVVAECVETTDQAARLQLMGCDNAQGWLYGRAMPGAEAGALLGRALRRAR